MSIYARLNFVGDCTLSLVQSVIFLVTEPVYLGLCLWFSTDVHIVLDLFYDFSSIVTCLW